MTKGYAIRITGWRRRAFGEFAVPVWIGAPAWLVWYDPEARAGDGQIQWSQDAEKARLFATREEAHDEITRRSVRFPEREDGEENRPLADKALTEVVEVRDDNPRDD